MSSKVDTQVVKEWIGVNGLIVLPFHRSHIDRLGLAEYDAMSIETLESKELLFQGMEDSEYSFTVFYNLQPMLSFGFDVKWTGVAEAWMFTGKVGREHGIILSRGARRVFDKIGPALDLRRMQIVVSVDRSDAVNWARFLKFEEEGRLKSYGPEGADYLMFARVYT
jgi:hypothetical protein